MLVVLANSLPPAVRGRMKLWFVEPRPNVFVSGIPDAIASEVVQYLHEHCPPESGVIIFRKMRQTPGFRIYSHGEPSRRTINISGLQLVEEHTECELQVVVDDLE